MTDNIRVDYKTLDEIAATFRDGSERTRRILDTLTTSTEGLKQNGGWEGDNADTHYRAMDEDILPTVQRLTEALDQAAEVTLQIKAVYQQAEREAAACLSSESENAVNEPPSDDDEKDLRPRYQIIPDFPPRDPPLIPDSEVPTSGSVFPNLTALTEDPLLWTLPPDGGLTEDQQEREWQRIWQEYLQRLQRQWQGPLINNPPTEAELRQLEEEARRRWEDELLRFQQGLRGPLINNPPTEAELQEEERVSSSNGRTRCAASSKISAPACLCLKMGKRRQLITTPNWKLDARS